MKRGSTLFLRAALLSIGLAILTVCVVVLPVGIREEATYRPVFVGMYVSAIPFFAALYQALQLLRFIDKDTAFSLASVRALQIIKYCALLISALYTLGSPLLYHLADTDDAPGVLALGLIIIFASLVIATFAAVLQRLLHNAIAIQSEHDLTV